MKQRKTLESWAERRGYREEEGDEENAMSEEELSDEELS